MRRDEVEAAFAMRVQNIRSDMETIPVDVTRRLLAMDASERTAARVHELLRVTITDAMTRSVASD